MSEPTQPTESIDVKGKPAQITIKPEIPTSLQQLKTETFKEKFDSFGKIQIKPTWVLKIMEWCYFPMFTMKNN